MFRRHRDPSAEAPPLVRLWRYARGHRRTVVAHRLSTVRHANRIHVLEAGRIVESGTHDTLLEERGLYAALWRIQTGEVHALRSTA
jgi:ATP-binding cassette subfamily B protein